MNLVTQFCIVNLLPCQHKKPLQENQSSLHLVLTLFINDDRIQYFFNVHVKTETTNAKRQRNVSFQFLGANKINPSHPIHLHSHPSIHYSSIISSTHSSVRPFIHLSIHPPIHSSIHLSIHTFIHSSTYPPTQASIPTKICIRIVSLIAE